jgi:putative PIG3 family NAD(P)H quinone oxidoreductase
MRRSAAYLQLEKVQKLKAIIVSNPGEEPQLNWDSVPDVDYDPTEVLVQIRATAVNRADLAQARGEYPPPPGVTAILGLEMAGDIVAVGKAVRGWKVGDRVCALLSGGGYAERTAVHQDMLLPLSDQWSYADGAAIPEAWYTAFVNLVIEGGLRAGETALIHAGGSGVGTAAIQLAAFEGASVFVTAGTEAKLTLCRELGAALAINRKEQDFLEEVLTETDDQGVDLILDPVGGLYLSRNIHALKPLGRLVLIGLLSGTSGELNLGLLLGKRLRLIGSLLRIRSLEEKISITRRFSERYLPAFHSGSLHPVIDSVFSITEAQAAHSYVQNNKNIGKVILEVD